MKRILLISLLAAISMNVRADEQSIPVSRYRKYIWAARDAYERRDFVEAGRLLKDYKNIGSPGDKLLEAAGCDPRLEVRLLSEALEMAHACMFRRNQSAHWKPDHIEAAKIAVTDALKAGDPAALEPYLDCAPSDETGRDSFCHTPVYPNLADFERFVSAVHAVPAIMSKPEWRDIHVTRESPSQIKPNSRDYKDQGFTAIDDSGQKWMLYTNAAAWHPCEMPGVPLLSLRQDKSGEVRIAGFAASCLNHQQP